MLSLVLIYFKRNFHLFFVSASDWTMYAFSTQNQKDYFNLMAVYLDAVLHPKLDEYDFM
jgi:Zn-dependent M16 (insulinase) family peptidase